MNSFAEIVNNIFSDNLDFTRDDNIFKSIELEPINVDSLHDFYQHVYNSVSNMNLDSTFKLVSPNDIMGIN